MAQDSQLLDIATVEGIDVTQKLRLAHEEICVDLVELLSHRNSSLLRVAVTPPLKLWHTYRTLEMFYADAYNCQLNDRYAGRRDQFHELAGWSREKLLQTGLGIVSTPVRRAATPTATSTPGGPLPDGTYYTTVTWMNGSGEEGAAANPTDVTTTGSTFAVQPGPRPNNAVGWNVFAGADPAALVQQNDVPLAPDATWQQFAPLALNGRAPGSGQRPNYLQPMPRLLQRG